MRKEIKWVIFWVVVLGLSVIFISGCKRHKTAGYYLDKIVELRQDKQNLLTEIENIDKQIVEYRATMDSIQYTGLDYLGFEQEADSQTKSQ